MVLPLLAATALTGCTALGQAAAAPGKRPGIDVPSDPAEASPRPIGTPPAVSGGEGGYAFMAQHTDGSPVTFDPCRPVHVAVNPAHEPAGGRDLLLEALGELSSATGLQFVMDPDTTEVMSAGRRTYQPDLYGDRWAPVLITWDSPASNPLLAGDVLGRAGPQPFAGTAPDSTRWVTAQAVFNAPALDAQMRLGRDEDAKAVLLHELAHVVGLHHVTDPYQVMYDTNAYPLPSYRAGDRRGLAELGLGRCYEDY
ncbi:MAG TPA: hypothetical protein VFR56_07425 [Actinomycetes bacterium]|nr:hypothetical protein [Actinomycetes bacterium]